MQVQVEKSQRLQVKNITNHRLNSFCLAPSFVADDTFEQDFCIYITNGALKIPLGNILQRNNSNFGNKSL